MARAIPAGAGAGAGAAGAAWVVPAVGAALVLSSGAVWVGGGIASMAAGHGWRSAPFGMLLAVDALRRGSAHDWPGTSPRLVWGAAAGLVVLVLLPVSALAVRWALRRPRADEPLRSLAKQADVRHLMNSAAVLSAQRLRTSLTETATKDVAAGDVGLVLGELLQLGRRHGPHLVTSWEDVLLAFMAPRQGKTTTYVVPPTLAAPGAVVCTSNKADAWAATASIRALQTGERVWTFDPQAIAHAQQTWWWDPLRGLDTVEEAERLAGHFVLTVEDDRSRDIWGPAAQELLAALLLAAKTCGGTILDVYDWLNDEATPVPAEVLRGAGLRGIAASLQGTQHSPPEARGSVYFTARVAAKCLRNPDITAWVTPPSASRLEEFDAAAFPMSRQSLYLLSKDGGGSAASLVAALTDRVLRAGVVAAERRGGRLDPPMLVLLDEAANICRIADLPQLYSHLGSRGIIPFTILQSYPQGVGVWGETGMKALWSAATVKVIGPGIDDPSFAEDLSRLIGDHDVLVEGGSVSDGRRSRSTSLRQQRILPASVIRALPKGRALVWVTGSKVAMIRTLPWYAGPRAGEVDAARRAAEAEMTASTDAALVSAALAGLATGPQRGAGEAA